MFDFFKKNKIPAPEITAEMPLHEALAETTPTIEPTKPAEPVKSAVPSKTWAERLKQGLSKTRNLLGGQLASLFWRRQN